MGIDWKGSWTKFPVIAEKVDRTQFSKKVVCFVFKKTGSLLSGHDMHGCSNLKCFCSAFICLAASDIGSPTCIQEIFAERACDKSVPPRLAEWSSCNGLNDFTWMGLGQDQARLTFAMSERGRSLNVKGSQGLQLQVAASV